MKHISLNNSIYNLSVEYPDVVDIMVQLGFSDITRPGMLQTVGRVMTLSKGAKMKNIGLEKIREVFLAEGFEIDEEV